MNVIYNIQMRGNAEWVNVCQVYSVEEGDDILKMLKRIYPQMEFISTITCYSSDGSEMNPSLDNPALDFEY